MHSSGEAIKFDDLPFPLLLRALTQSAREDEPFDQEEEPLFSGWLDQYEDIAPDSLDPSERSACVAEFGKLLHRFWVVVMDAMVRSGEEDSEAGREAGEMDDDEEDDDTYVQRICEIAGGFLFVDGICLGMQLSQMKELEKLDLPEAKGTQ